MSTTRIAEEMEKLRRRYGVTGRYNGLYMGWAEGMTRRIARKIARKLARKPEVKVISVR
jgi:hypothetical protein